MLNAALARASPEPAPSGEAWSASEKDLYDQNAELDPRVRYKLRSLPARQQYASTLRMWRNLKRHHLHDRLLSLSVRLDPDHAYLREPRAQNPSSDAAHAPRPGTAGGPRPQTREPSEDAKMCIRVLESSMGRPANLNVTARDLDSMLADYVDENEDSVELVRSVRDGPE